MNSVKKVLLGSALALALIGGGSALAQTATTPVDQLETETAKLTDVYDDVLPVAIGAMAFSIGAVIIKRIAFA